MPTSDPVVCCVLLASGREEMVARAVRCFQAQTYRNKRLLVLDNGRPRLKAVYPPPPIPENGVYVTCDPASIGVLRNRANKHATQLTGADIIAHWDSDDWSHPNRIAEQVALLQSSGAECVGYNEMLFWFNTRGCQTFMSPGPPWYAAQCLKPIHHIGDCEFGTKEQAHASFYHNVRKEVISSAIQPGSPVDNHFGESWLYRSQLPNYAIGTSMMYWRGTWERTPFAHYDDSKGCDDLYWHNGDTKHGVKPVKIEVASAMQSIPECMIPKPIGGGRVELTDPLRAFRENPSLDLNPRMIASIHGGNTCAEIKPGVEWRRASEWDEYCRREMAL